MIEIPESSVNPIATVIAMDFDDIPEIHSSGN
jgi:hypothetical protein